jgi:hypothetical protein
MLIDLFRNMERQHRIMVHQLDRQGSVGIRSLV